jgi:hypothetical protein
MSKDSLKGLNGKRVIKATIIDPLSDRSSGVVHYNGELEPTLEKIRKKYLL